MPFDSLPIRDEMNFLPQLKLFYERRQSAAALWRSVPVHEFTLRYWTTWNKPSPGVFVRSCGSTACALGWLGHTDHDGWSISSIGVPVYQDRYAIEAAAFYFGLFEDNAKRCFGAGVGRGAIEHFYGTSVTNITPAMVADKLIQLPYKITGRESMVSAMEVEHSL